MYKYNTYACIKYIMFIFDYISSILEVVYMSNHIAMWVTSWLNIYIIVQTFQ